MTIPASLRTSLTDEALVSLASVGLLRRARKDCEKQAPRVVEETSRGFLVACEDGAVTVTIPMTGARDARCTCPAQQRCRHVLAACLTLGQSLGEPPPAPEAMPTTEESPQAPAPTSGPAAPAALDARGGADSLTEGASQGTRAPAAVKAGGSADSPPGRAPRGAEAPAGGPGQKASTGAPRSREEVLASVRAALGDLVALGFSRLSQASHDRLVTLAVSARGVDLALMERLLRALAEQVSSALSHEVSFDSRDLLQDTARAWVVASALAIHDEPRPEALVGQFRTHYDDVPDPLLLHGMGAWQWRSASGYAGLTVAFWDPAREAWATWSDSRPEFYTAGAFDPHRSYVLGSVWETAPPLRVCRRHVTVSGARRNPAGRLSSQAFRAQLGAATEPQRLPLGKVRFDDWRALATFLRERQGTGIVEPDPLQNLVVVAPAAWGHARWDEALQQTQLPVVDARGRILVLILPHVEAWSFATRTFHACEPDRLGAWGVLGFARVEGPGLAMEPVCIYHETPLPSPLDSPILNLTLDVPLQARPRGARLQEPPSGTFPMQAWLDSAPPSSTRRVPLTGDPRSPAAPGSAHGLEGTLDQALGLLEDAAEAGAATFRSGNDARCNALADRLARCGLDTGASALRRLSAAQGTPVDRAAPLLWAWWLLRAARREVDAARAAERLAGFAGSH